MADNPLVNLGDLSKPAVVLVEKISDAVGGIFKPYQIVRVAKAEQSIGSSKKSAQELWAKREYRFASLCLLND